MPIITGKKKRRNTRSLDREATSFIKRRAVDRIHSSPVSLSDSALVRVITPKWFSKEKLICFFKQTKDIGQGPSKANVSQLSREYPPAQDNLLVVDARDFSRYLDGALHDLPNPDTTINTAEAPAASGTNKTFSEATTLLGSPSSPTSPVVDGQFFLDGPVERSESRRFHRHERVRNAEPRKSKSMSDLFRSASNRVLHPHTVIRRPKRAPFRPSVLPSQNGSPFVFDDMWETSTAPSSPGVASFRSTPPRTQTSTAKTSLYSSSSSSGNTMLRSCSAPVSTIANLATITETPTQHPFFWSQDVPDDITYSLATVELAASAKAFLEMHFDSILNSPMSPRMLRRCDLEARLCTMPMPQEARQEARRRWLMIENENLRKERVMKSGSQTRRNSKGVSLAGYEVVRVLGKGSFGVVRLVRERPNTDSTGSQCSNGTSSGPLKEKDKAKTLVELNKRQNEIFAMKVIRKSDMLRNSQEGHLRAERDFLVASATSRWVVPLISSFQDSKNLYLVMEYMVGGDFLGLLLREDMLDENVAKQYVAEMILCVEEAHRMRWIHRDVKPDNFLINSQGHLKISDFGLAFDGHWSHNQQYYNQKRYSLLEKYGHKINGDEDDQKENQEKVPVRNRVDPMDPNQIRREQAFGTVDEPRSEPVLDELNRVCKRKFAKSVVGTSQYMAPEIIRGESYDGRCDWWSIGIILYECLYGQTPFYQENRQLTKQKILDHTRNLQFHHQARYARPHSDRIPLAAVSYHAIDLIYRLLQEKERRLSSTLYRENDYQRRASIHTPRRQSHLSTCGNFVYPNDAEDIKAHPFFREINWEHLHEMRPPFTPLVRDKEAVTKYFDKEEDIMSSGDRDIDFDSSDDEEDARLIKKGRDGKEKEKKRPRDKILRDEDMKKIAMEIRQKNAFLGYTYRRSKMVRFWGETGEMAEMVSGLV